MRLLIVTVFLSTWSPANADNFYMGRELLKHCENCVHSTHISNINVCAYCINNISMMHDAFVDWGFMEPKWCLASEITFRELTTTAMMFIRENPDSIHQYSTNLIADSLAKNYPCSQ